MRTPDRQAKRRTVGASLEAGTAACKNTAHPVAMSVHYINVFYIIYKSEKAIKYASQHCTFEASLHERK